MRKTIFFSLLCAFFLKSLCLSEEAYSTEKEFVKPIILSDYSSGTLFTNLGGLSGGDEEKPGTTYTALIPDDDFARGNSGYSVMLDYNVSGMGEFSYYWIKLGREVPNWPGVTKTLDLSSYNYLSFWVRGRKGGEKIKIELHQDIDNNGMFVFGKDITSTVYVDAYIKEGFITKEWKKVVVPLKDFSGISDWSKALELVLVFENRSGNASGAIYVDDILFGKRADWVLESPEVNEINPPVAGSFKVNGVGYKQCLAFTRSNTLAINAESIKDNSFIESVAFEYTTDRGKTWRVIGEDFDVATRNYEFSWHPKGASELYNYQVRAIATDIRGNRKETEVLLDCGVKPLTDNEFLDLVERKAFEYFVDHQNLKTGLFADTAGGGDASIASTGVGIAALAVGSYRGWIERDEAEMRVRKALDAFLPQGDSEKPFAEGKNGFFYHFLDIHTGKRAGKSELSTVDTAIFVAGAITAGEYFGGDIRVKSKKIYERVEWDKFLIQEEGPWKNLFTMGWSPEKGMLDSYWDYYTDEVILINLLAIGSPTHPVDPESFYAWTRHEGAYKNGKPFIYTWHGALFSYQYAHMWFDLRGYKDKKGVDWFENSKNATLANRQFCIDNKEEFKTFGPNTWGITSMARPTEYTMHFGVPPMGSGDAQYDGTISPTGPAGSIIFTPIQSLSALKYMYLNYPGLWGKYGFRDSFDLELNWYSNTYYGIGEAMYLIPIENFRSEFVWQEFMKNEHIKDALKKAGFVKGR